MVSSHFIDLIAIVIKNKVRSAESQTLVLDSDQQTVQLSSPSFYM